jgi:hypothetical protein
MYLCRNLLGLYSDATEQKLVIMLMLGNGVTLFHQKTGATGNTEYT